MKKRSSGLSQKEDPPEFHDPVPNGTGLNGAKEHRRKSSVQCKNINKCWVRVRRSRISHHKVVVGPPLMSFTWTCQAIGWLSELQSWWASTSDHCELWLFIQFLTVRNDLFCYNSNLYALLKTIFKKVKRKRGIQLMNRSWYIHQSGGILISNGLFVWSVLKSSFISKATTLLLSNALQAKC